MGGQQDGANGNGGGKGQASTPSTLATTTSANGGGIRTGLDSGLAKSAPQADGLTQKSYRSYRRRLVLFSMQCHRRGRETAVEGAFLAVSLLNDAAWEATEQLDFENMEREERPFKPLLELLDGLYQYEDVVEVPNRCEEFFQDFSRAKGEEMQAYLIRHATMMKKMKEIKVEIPELLAGWHLLTRAGVPRWTHVQVKALCGGDLVYEKVNKALMRMFGADHKPNPKDLMKAGREETFYEEHIEDEAFYEYDEDYGQSWDDYPNYDEDEAYFEDEENYDDAVPSDLENAADLTEEAYVNYMESRRRMKEIALNRGFYPIVALGPEAMHGKGRGEGRGQKGRGKGKTSKGKGKGKSYPMRRSPTTRRPMSGLRRQGGGASSTSSSTASTEFRSTLSGSTASHGPRFKRYRLQSNGVKEVPEENVAMVEEEVIHIEECYYMTNEIGKAIVDSGATRTIVGEEVWRSWLEDVAKHGQSLQVSTKPQIRDFRFGDGGTARSHYEIEFMAGIKGQKVPIKASVIAGRTPFLLARPTLETLEVKQNYGNGTMSVMNSEWFQPERGQKGHYMLNLLDYANDEMDKSYAIVDDEVLEYDMEIHPEWTIEPVLEAEIDSATTTNENIGGYITVDFEDINIVVDKMLKRAIGNRELRFWEVYVDKGSLSNYLAEKYPDVVATKFGLPDWDFSKKEVRQKFLVLINQIQPHFIWFAPPCTKWSPMQRINIKNEIGREHLQQVRDQEEGSHLELVAQSFKRCKVVDAGAGLEHPDPAESWRTTTWRNMKGFFEAVVDRCRTGLVCVRQGKLLGKVRKRTRIRTTSKKVAMAMDLQCQCGDEPHVQMIGLSNILKEMQNYEAGFVRRAGDAIYNDMEERWMRREAAAIMVAEEIEMEEAQAELKSEDWKKAKVNSTSAVRVVAKLHRQLGHPNNDKLVRALRDAKVDEAIIKEGINYRCETCESHKLKPLEKPTALPRASFFNEVIEMDTFHLKWDDVKCKVLAIIDVYSRFETNAIIQSETIEEELDVMQKQWISWAGFPKVIKTDSSGAHMSEFFQAWCDDKGIKLVLVPKEAHHQLGLVERLHAVRRQQLYKMKKEKPDLKLESAVLHACDQRNRLRSVHGASPVSIVFGYTPAQAGISDEPHGVRPDGHPRQLEDAEIRILAAKTFYAANHSNTIRRALLAKSRKEHEPLQVGDYAYYWRTSNDKLEPSRWRGPALICAVETREASEGVLRPSVYWLAHGCDLVRVAPEHIRLEVTSERAARLENIPQSAAREPLRESLVKALRPVRGPIRFLDFAPHGSRSDARDAQDPQNPPGDDHPPASGLGFGIDDQSLGFDSMASGADPPTQRKKEDSKLKKRRKEKQAENEKKKEELRQETEKQLEDLINEVPAEQAVIENDMATADNAVLENALAPPNDEVIENDMAVENDNVVVNDMAEKKKPRRDRSRSPPPVELMRQSYVAARVLDGLPGRHQMTDEQMRSSRGRGSQETEDDEFLAEEFDERRLSKEEKAMFDEAKDKALMVWIDNSAWRAVDEHEAGAGEVVPARFLQRWKKTPEGQKANARVIIQGFKHKDVLEKELETDSPTLSRVGRMLIYVMAVHQGWKIFSADVKSAFMQADSIDESTRIYVKPTAEMRRRLERLMGLKPHQILKATKPAFGDVRAPRQWYETADGVVTCELYLIRHPLDRCVFISARLAHAGDDEFCIFEREGQKWIVDGVLGLHVDDFIGAGEKVFSLDDLEGDYDGSFPTFRDRLCGLSRRFRFGSWAFGNNMTFCGAEVEQSLDFTAVSISMADYVKRVKPISIDKHRKTMVGDACNDVEKKQLRAIVGAMAWPGNQCLPQVSATCSLLQAAVSSPTVADLIEANRGLKFLKEVGKEFKLSINRHCNLQDLRFGVYADAAWAVRPDSASQGGHLVFLCSKDEMLEGKAMKISIVDWSSKKLNRVCRSSLSAEAQSATAAVDALEWVKVFWAVMLWPNMDFADDQALLSTGESPVLTDAKALFDSVNSLTQSKVTEKRTSIEIVIIQQRLQAMASRMRWVNSGQQLADGLTKRQARENFAYLLQRGVHRLVYDDKFVADKKVKKEDKENQRREMEALSKEMYEGQIFMAEDEEKGEKMCQLKGCNKEIDKGNGKNRFCSRRHFYLDHHRRFGHSDQWKKAAMGAAAILAISEMDRAEAAAVTKESDDGHFFNTMLVLVFFAAIGAYGIIQKCIDLFEYIKTIFLNTNTATANDQIPEYAQVPEEIYASRRHGERMANDPVIEFDEVTTNVNAERVPTSLWRPSRPNDLGVSEEKFVMIEKVRAGKVKDKIVQTEQTYDFKAARPRLKPAHWSMHGAFHHVSDWDPKD